MDEHLLGSEKPKKEIGCSCENSVISIKANSLCLRPCSSPQESSQEANANTRRIQSFRRTVRVLQLDHSHYGASLLSWVVCLVLMVIIPLLRLWFVKASSTDTEHELIFQPFVVIVGTALSFVSFLFLSHAIRAHGLRGVLFLDAAEEEVTEVQEEYDAIIERGRMVLAKLFIPSLLIFIAFKSWFYTVVELQPLPFESTTTILSISIIIVCTTISWIFQTTTYLYVCVLFSTVCSLQDLKMERFKTLLESGLDPEIYFTKYVHITKGLQETSHRFRAFLGLILTITIVGFLASMYKVVAAERAGIDAFMSVELVILNVVTLSGVGLCLRASSKISHLHRRIAKAATLVHARITFETGKRKRFAVNKNVTNDSILERLNSFREAQDEWCRWAALVNFLSCSSVGISVYGFILDRFFIHASVGALLTTTWFILGRSLA